MGACLLKMSELTDERSAVIKKLKLLCDSLRNFICKRALDQLTENFLHFGQVSLVSCQSNKFPFEFMHISFSSRFERGRGYLLFIYCRSFETHTLDTCIKILINNTMKKNRKVQCPRESQKSNNLKNTTRDLYFAAKNDFWQHIDELQTKFVCKTECWQH